MLSIVPDYKYLGTILDQHLYFNTNVMILPNAAGRALGSVIAKFSSLKNVGYKTYTKMFKERKRCFN